MSNEVKKQEEPLSAKSLFAREDVQKKFAEMLGKRSTQFLVSVLQIVNSNEKLLKADPMSIYNSAVLAATLDLPLNNNLGFAYIVPYEMTVEVQGNKKKKMVAQFQIGYKGFKQLALRTGQFSVIHATDVREGELENHDRLTGDMKFKWIENDADRLKASIVGYVSYFRLQNGFTSSFYMSMDKLRQHGKKYSKTFDFDSGLWKKDEDGMCLKTVTKLNLSKNAPLSVEIQMQTAIRTDQAVLLDDKGEKLAYADNATEDAEIIDVNKEEERIKLMIADCETLDDLDLLQTSNPDIDVKWFDDQREIIKAKKK